MPTQLLYEQFNILSQHGVMPQNISATIKDNLNQDFTVRPYQIEAFSRYTHYINHQFEGKQTPPYHLCFNMATGSGKTLIMAGLMLDLYQRGHRNFLFFVNSNNIIAKTKDNFLNSASKKFLFAQQIVIDNVTVPILEVDNFENSNPHAINICFTTIQKLHSDLYNEKENQLTREDFRKYKIVLISDEAHHIQAATKKKKQDSELIEKPSRENTVEKIFRQNHENFLLEFTATLFDDANTAVIEKYNDKVIFRYDLKQFRHDGYSKDIYTLASDFEIEDRILQAVILNQYRQEVATKHGINLKPVMLFKANQTIEESKSNEELFHHIIANLSPKTIDNLRKKVSEPIMIRCFDFFRSNNISDTILIQKLQHNFAPNKCINVNEENLDKASIKQSDKKELISQQTLLNSLEDKNNQIRAIFAVNKLNEGWDVLNLFDIVRLYDLRDGDWMRDGSYKPGKTTIAEAQLIGRGARYNPFVYKEYTNKDTRKFDHDPTHELKILEELHYHSVYNTRYIAELRKALVDKGLIDENIVEKELKLKPSFVQTNFFQTGIIYLNKPIKNDYQKIKGFADFGISKKNMVYQIATGKTQNSSLMDTTATMSEAHSYQEDRNIKDMPLHIVQNAIAKHPFFSFDNIKKYFPNITSTREFILDNDHMGGLSITFQGVSPKQLFDAGKHISNKDMMQALHILLDEIERELKSNMQEFTGDEKFDPYQLKDIFHDKVLRIRQGDERENGQESFVGEKERFAFNANFGTTEEKAFVSMFDRMIQQLEQNYDDIYLLRNELHFKIYNFKDGQAFAPDFVLFLKQKNGEHLTYQMFIEPKGAHLKDNDKRKEDFLKEIKEKFKDTLLTFNESKKYKITGVPFYNNNEENLFKQTLHDEISA